MFCIRCGKQNPDDAVYCQKCGSLIGTEDATQVAVRPNLHDGRPEDEAEIFSVGPTLVFVKIGYVVAGLAAVAFVAVTAPLLGWYYGIPIGLCFLLIPAYKHLRRRLIRYTLTDSKIEIDHGFVVQNARIVPLRSIQDVAVRSSVMQRVLGFGDVVIDNASEEGGKVVLKDMPTPKKYADLLLKELRKLHR